MKITSGTKELYVPLEQVKNGECFRLHDKLYLKTDWDSVTGIHCIDLANGETYDFMLSAVVEPMVTEVKVVE